VDDWKLGLRGESESVDEVIENVKADEHMRDICKVLRSDITPSTLSEKRSAGNAGQPIKNVLGPGI
jgi:hypothetical protein